MRKIFISNFLFLVVCLPFTANAFSGSEVHITKDGSANISGAKVMQIAGQTFFTRLYWGDAFVRLTVKGTSKTKVLRGTGELTTFAEIKENDLLDLVGTLESGGDTLSLIPRQIKNSSVQKEQKTLFGKVVSIDLPNSRFALDTKGDGLVTVLVGTSTQFFKGSRTIDLNRLKVNDKITKLSGDYDYKTKTIPADAVSVYFDTKLLKPKIYIGTLESISNTNLPTSFPITIGKTKYLIELSASTSVLNKNRSSINLSRFEVGDTIRIYGSLREADELIIDAEVVRNISI
ncbi:MAG: hypothetical protein Q7S34_00315 [bacterium]|nr:hypothetical protein [bacterium]